MPCENTVVAGGLRGRGQAAGNRGEDDEASAGLGTAQTRRCSRVINGQRYSPSLVFELPQANCCLRTLLAYSGVSRYKRTLKSSICYGEGRSAVRYRITRAMWFERGPTV